MLSYDKIIFKVFDGFKRITPALMAVMITSGAIIFLPSNVLESLGLHELSPIWRTIIGIAFLVSTALIVTIVVSMICKFVYSKFFSKIYNRIRIKHLRKKYDALDLTHKKIIIDILKTKNKSRELDATSGDVIYLCKRGFIYAPEQISDAFSCANNMYKFVPHPWIIDYYIEKTECFQI